MNPNDAFDRDVSDWLHEDAEHRVPEHLDAVLRRDERTATAAGMVEPRKVAPRGPDLSREHARAAPARPGHRRRSAHPGARRARDRRRRVSPAARAASVRAGPQRHPAFERRWRHLLGRPDVCARATPLITGDTFDFGPGFSRDGTKFSFLRAAPADCGQPDCGLILMVANADGTGIRALTPAMQGLDAIDWSPDGTQIAMISFAEGTRDHVLDIVNVDGSGMRRLDVGRPVHVPAWLPPDGREIVVQGEGDLPPGIFAVQADGGGVRELTTRTPFDANDFKDSGVSPDGTRIGYRGDDGPGGLFRSHILDLRTGQDRVLPQPPEATAQTEPLFSPDGQTVVYVRFYSGRHRSSSSWRPPTAPTSASQSGPASRSGRTARTSTTSCSRRTARRCSPTTTPSRRRASCRSMAHRARSLSAASSRFRRTNASRPKSRASRAAPWARPLGPYPGADPN